MQHPYPTITPPDDMIPLCNSGNRREQREALCFQPAVSFFSLGVCFPGHKPLNLVRDFAHHRGEDASLQRSSLTKGRWHNLAQILSKKERRTPDENMFTGRFVTGVYTRKLAQRRIPVSDADDSAELGSTIYSRDDAARDERCGSHPTVPVSIFSSS